MKTNDSDDKFYRELDEKASHKSCCTCQTLILLFAIFLLIATGAVLFLYFQITKGGAMNSPRATISQNYQKKLDNPTFDVNGEFQVELTSDDLTSLLSEGFSTENFVLKEVNVSVNPSEMLVYGSLVKPIGSKVIIGCIPKAENGKLKLEIKNISAGKINLPVLFNQKISESLSGLIDKKMSDFYQKNEIKQIVLQNNQIIIIGKAKTK